MKAPNPGKRRLDITLEPVTGKALRMRRGEVLRLTQVEGGQCVGFNCFNADDYKEYMSVGHLRREDFHPKAGQIIWSNPPRFRPMFRFLHLAPSCVVDTLVGRCSAVLFESQFGVDDHPNCQDTLAEAIGEYGLTPDDCHDPLHFWMNTKEDHVGYYTGWNDAKKGDHVDLMALMNVIAIPVICGAGNFSVSSNFSYKPIRIEVFAASQETRELAMRQWKTHTSLKSQRLPGKFLNPVIPTDSELTRDPSFEPQFVNFPIEWKEIEVVFTDEEFRRIWRYRGTLGDTDEEVVRTLFFHWYLDNRKKRGLRWYTPQQSHA